MKIKRVLKKNKKILIIIAAVLILSAGILWNMSNKIPKLGSLSNKTPLTKNSSSENTSSVPFLESPYKEDGITFADERRVQKSYSNIDKLSPNLPIYITFTSSNGIKTEINIYRIILDDTFYIHIDINGIDYESALSSESDPNVIAFKESFSKLKETLNGYGVNINDLYVIFGGREKIKNVAKDWIVKFDLNK